MADISTVESEAEAGVFNSFIDTRWLALHNQPFSVSAFRETLKVHFEPKGHENQFSIKYTVKSQCSKYKIHSMVRFRIRGKLLKSSLHISEGAFQDFP